MRTIHARNCLEQRGQDNVAGELGQWRCCSPGHVRHPLGFGCLCIVH